MATLTDRASGLKPRGDRALPRLVLMTDAERLSEPEAQIRRLPPGSMVVFRHYGAPGRHAMAAKLAGLCRRRRIRFLVAGDWRLAAAVAADGLHLPESLARRGPGPWSRWRRKGRIVTVAAHSRVAVFRAARAGADAVLLAPVFVTASHPDRPALGPVRFAALVRRSPVPVYALGGVDPLSARRLVGAGQVGFAGISGIAALAGNRGMPRVATP